VCEGDKFEIKFGGDADMAADLLKSPKAQETIAQVLTKEAGRPLSIKVIVAHKSTQTDEGPDISEMFGVENIEIIGRD